MWTYSSGSVTDSHRIPFSIRALLLIPTIRYSKLGAKILLFYELCKELIDFLFYSHTFGYFKKKPYLCTAKRNSVLIGPITIHHSIMLLIFDLDGTLLNTIADLGMACNHALQALGYPPHALEEYPHLVGNGVNKLIERALPAEVKISSEQTHDLILRMRAEFIPYYNAHNLDLTRPYPGVPEVLESLKAAGHKLAVASNKYQEATEKVVAHFFPNTFDVVYGEREGIERKPDPTIVLNIFDALHQSSEQTLYVGDSLVDIATARNAKVPVAACTWGFCSREELAAAEPDYLLEKAEELPAIVQELNKK